MELKAKILVVEDEKNLGKTLQEYLEGLGHNCFLATNAKEAKKLFTSHAPSIVLMDIGLPDGNGLELAREFKEIEKKFVLLFLSAQNDPEVRVAGLELGAEDYITKPFALRELVLRLERISESNKQLLAHPDEINHGPLKIWFKRYEVQDAHGNLINLTQKHNAILQMLYQKQGNAITREEIIKQIWGKEKFPSNRTVDNYIVKLRKWCETDKNNHIEIQSIRSIGYKLTIK